MNVSPVGFFDTSCGFFRQGDPLSPLPFIIFVDAVNKMILGLVESGFLYGFLVIMAITAQLIFLICFLLMKLSSSMKQIMGNSIFERALLCFEAIFGLRVNLSKP